MRALSLVAVLILFAPAALFAQANPQAGSIGIFTDAQATSCNLTAPSTGLYYFYIVHINNSMGIGGVEFAAPKPACLNGTWLSDQNQFAVTIGTTQSSYAVGYGRCRVSQTHICTMVFFAIGATPDCCTYPVVGSPTQPGDPFQFSDCNLNLVLGAGGYAMVNSTPACPCGPPAAPSVPHDPVPPNGAQGQPVALQLGWQSENQLGGPLSYDVYFGTASAPPLVADHLDVPVYNPGVLQHSTHYYWRIMARSEWGTTMGPTWDFTTTAPGASELRVSSFTNYCGFVSNDTVRVEISISNSASAIDAAGLDLTFDPAVLTFLACSPGELTQNWDYFGGSDRGGYIRIGGFDVTPIPSGTSGVFARLLFVHPICSAPSAGLVSMCPQNLTDDLVGISPFCGEYEYHKFDADGDVNASGSVTPGDALCAFKAYLSIPNPPESECAPLGWDVRADVDCSMSHTPADALCIFEHWLDGSCQFCIDWPGAPAFVQQANPLAQVTLKVVKEAEGMVSVPIRISQVHALKAFGLELAYPADQLEFVEIARSPSTMKMDQLDVAVVERGLLRIGGYTTRAIDASRPTNIAVVHFKASNENLSGAITIDAFVDHLKGADPLTVSLGPETGEPQLFQNVPYPVTPTTEIGYEIPSAMPVSLVIYNVEGKRVRTLVNRQQPAGIYREQWDSRSDSGDPVSSGVYFCVLKAGPQVIKKKMLLLK